MARKLASALMAALMGAPPSTMALGLGKLDANSALNEPLLARIPLLSVGGNDVASVRVSLASPAAFEHAGLARPYYLSRLKFEIKEVDGEHYILISTEQAIKEPFLDFLLNVRWPQGNLQREYTVLLDPPKYSVGEPPATVGSNHVSATQAGLQNTNPSPSQAPTKGAVAGERANRSTRYGPVQANQTLWGIAEEVRPSHGVTVYQTMQAILLANPEAFIDGNINALMKGAVLRVPPRAEIVSIDAHQATLQLQEQLARWQMSHSSGGSTTPPAQARAQATAMGQGEVGTAEAPIPPTPLAKGRLHVVAASEDTETHATVALADQALAPTQQNILRLQQQLALVAERNANLASANERLQQQASSLKKELTDLNGNVPLDEAVPLPGAESVTKQGGEATSGAQQASAVDPGGEAASAGASGMPSSSHLETTEHAANGRSAVLGTSGSGGSQPTAVADNTKSELDSSRAEPEAAANPQSDSSLKARLLAYLSLDAKRIGLLGVGLLLVLMLLWALRRRSAAARRHALPPEAPSSVGTRAVTSVEPAGTRANLGRADVQAQAGSAVEESNSLDEAEAYIAYGHYDRAQELLDHALGEHPDNRELRLKLLEVLAAQGDRGGFEAEAQVLHTQLADEADPHWQQAIQLARRIAPDHPLFNDTLSFETATGTTGAQPEQGERAAAATTAKSTDTPMAQVQATEADFELSISELALDHSGNSGEAGRQPTAERQESAVLEFDLGEIEAFASQRAQAAASASSSAEDSADDGLGSLDFSLSEDWAAQSESISEKDGDDDQDVPQRNDFTLQNELDPEDERAAKTPEDSMGSDEVGTKLDLARAYLDMGDMAGARSLLSEVVTEGNTAQQSEAQDLLRRVG
ncbi:FimV/HubP family polar landmark protein [Nitrococcus mobilis]|uniref:Peptidoglycan-binding LysM n=1 Tax=Nitrococcus mobilis Nb-231 TaxID=314278 RepID=A4BSZ8_9GAMM|nr:FimV/HubP family polar landmark protein [Nitrococcus mobilis]EAR21242.1 Peptidoglycan-binding LysM [Nitrococcus mobilis Nb-231]